MTNRRHRAHAVLMRLFLIASAMTALVAVTVAVRRAATHRVAATETAPGRLTTLLASAEPIPGEADVFRTDARALAIDPSAGFRRSAHPRTLATYRALRAYPGAPPRVPHGLTPEEFQTGDCNTCHERGGYSERFGAYVPVTPHPDFGACLQCHVGDGALMAIPLPAADPSARCRQCHAPGATRWTESTIDWQPMEWPELPETRPDDAPPPIPHDLRLRGNCLACHAAPAAVAEIGTPHPERADCRECHVTADAGVSEFRRPVPPRAAAPGGAR